MPDVLVRCGACGAERMFDGIVGRSARCARCGADLRCCTNCRFHDTSAYNECSEPAAERVVEKDRANFCDYFSPAPAGSSQAGAAVPGGDAADTLEQLFRKR